MGLINYKLHRFLLINSTLADARNVSSGAPSFRMSCQLLDQITIAQTFPSQVLNSPNQDRYQSAMEKNKCEKDFYSH
jgi:hypothetical protein